MRARNVVASLSLALCLLALGPVACDDSNLPPPPPPGQNGPTLRIISLSPALTLMLEELGGKPFIVGVDDSHNQVFDDNPYPTVGQFNKLNTEAVVAAKPTHVVALVGEEGVPEALDKLASSSNFKLITYPYPSKVQDVDRIMRGAVVVGEPGKTPLTGEDSIARLLDRDMMGTTLTSKMNMLMLQVEELTSTVAPVGEKPRVLLVIGTEPRVRVSGPKTVLHDVLTNYAGGYNAAIPDLKPLTDEDRRDPKKVEAWFKKDPADAVGTAPLLDREQLLEARPDVIVLILPGAPPLEDIALDPRLADFRGLDVPAVKNGRIVLINDKEAALPSTSLPGLTADLAKAIHPSLTKAIDEVMTPPKPEAPVDPQTEAESPEVAPPDRTSAQAD